MTMIDVIAWSCFKMVKAINDKDDNCAYVGIASFTVNLSVLFCLLMKKSLNVKKIIAMQIFLLLHLEHKGFFVHH